MEKYRPTESAYLNGEDEEVGTKTVAINGCYGGFGLSPKATQLYLKKIGKECFFYKQTGYKHNNEEKYEQIDIVEATETGFVVVMTKDFGPTMNTIDNDYFWYETFYEDRSNKELIETIKELGEKESSGTHAEIRLVEIPADVEYTIEEYDGIESIHEVHRSW